MHWGWYSPHVAGRWRSTNSVAARSALCRSTCLSINIPIDVLGMSWACVAHELSMSWEVETEVDVWSGTHNGERHCGWIAFHCELCGSAICLQRRCSLWILRRCWDMGAQATFAKDH